MSDEKTNQEFLEELEKIYRESYLKIFGLVGNLAGAAATAAQASVGAQSTVGGASVEAGQSSQTTQTGAAHKNDVSVPEVIESLNASLLQDIASMGKVNARTFDSLSASIALAHLQATASIGAQMGNVTTQQNEEYSRRKDAGTVRLVALTDLGKEVADDSDGK